MDNNEQLYKRSLKNYTDNLRLIALEFYMWYLTWAFPSLTIYDTTSQSYCYWQLYIHVYKLYLNVCYVNFLNKKFEPCSQQMPPWVSTFVSIKLRKRNFTSDSHVNLKPGFFGGRKQLESDDHFVLEIWVYKVILNLFLMWMFCVSRYLWDILSFPIGKWTDV